MKNLAILALLLCGCQNHTIQQHKLALPVPLPPMPAKTLRRSPALLPGPEKKLSSVTLEWLPCGQVRIDHSSNLVDWAVLDLTTNQPVIIGCTNELDLFRVKAPGGLTIAWDPSPSVSVVGYKVYWGVSSQHYTNSIDAGPYTFAVVRGCAPVTTYYFAATAYDWLGAESDFSAEIAFTTEAVWESTVPTRILVLPP